MNHQLWNSTAARVTAAMFIIAGVTACGDRLSDTNVKATEAVPASPSAVVVGTAPAQPSGDPPGTTPVAPNTTDVTKPVEQQAMPQPGQPNDHSNVAPMPSQKSGEAATTESEAKQANNGERTK